MTSVRLLLEFGYDDGGARIAKRTYTSTGTLLKTTWYLGGMIYEQVGASTTVTQIEVPIPSGTFYRTTGEYVYSLSDHLGNVRAVVPRGFNPASLQATLNRLKFFSDYYPFGWGQPGRDQGLYRYGYQGQEKDPETNWYAFQLRMYDGRIGRWMTTDPAGQYYSPYLAMGNNPGNGTDPDGGKFLDWVRDKNGNVYWDDNATSQATTKAGETYLGHNLHFRFDSYIDYSFDGPNPPWGAEGRKLMSSIDVISTKDWSTGKLLSVDVSSSYDIGSTGDLGIFKGRDFFSGLGDDQNKSISLDNVRTFVATFEQHASVPLFEEIGLNAMGYQIVNVAQKVEIGLNGNQLSIKAFTDRFPSATLILNGKTLFQYNQPSFSATHGRGSTYMGNNGMFPIFKQGPGIPKPNFYQRY